MTFLKQFGNTAFYKHIYNHPVPRTETGVKKFGKLPTDY